MAEARRRHSALLTLVLSLTAVAGNGEASARDGWPIADLAADLRPILTRHARTPAAFGAVVEQGRSTALGAVGLPKAGVAVPVTVDDLIHLGSDTKTMTAVLVGMLVQARQLAWGEYAVLAAAHSGVPDAAAACGEVCDALVRRHVAGLR